MASDGFEDMVVSVMDAIGYETLDADRERRVRLAVRQALTLTWNMRGKLDLAKLELAQVDLHKAIMSLDQLVEGL